jgi:DNA modification methylase
MTLEWTNDRRRLGDLVDWERNPRTVTEEQAERLQRSLDEFGQIQTLAIEPDDTLVDGHQRAHVWEVAQKFGPDHEVDVRVASRKLTDAEREAVVAALHGGAAGRWDWDALRDFDFDALEDWGFDDDLLRQWQDDAAELAEMIGSEEEEPPEDPGAQIDRAEELREKWGVRSGDLWQLGSHRLVCGDCTDAEVVARVMGGEKVNLIVTDPPYGVSYEGGANNEVKREALMGDKDTRLYRDYLAVAPIADKCAVYMWHADRRANEVYRAATEAGFEIRSQIIWHKLKAHYGAWMAQYKQKHEPCIYCVKGAPEFTGPTNEVTVWEYEQPSRNENHPTEKPVELMERAIGNHPYEAVYDPFVGSGTTIIACERLGRRCRAVEISPAYVAVCLQRFYDMTGEEPVLLERLD